ncbi:MAG TPA: glutaredoxin family protein [Planctomycetota bacterium]|nr:glutaredoxin family protein [Planctomycetota bacterium]
MYRTRTCPLCDEALEILERARRRARFALDVHDVTDDPSKLAEHRLEVPVVFVDGRKRFMGRVDPVLLKRLLEREPDA